MRIGAAWQGRVFLLWEAVDHVKLSTANRAGPGTTHSPIGAYATKLRADVLPDNHGDEANFHSFSGVPGQARKRPPVRSFAFAQHGTNLRREVVAGLTTFLMSPAGTIMPRLSPRARMLQSYEPIFRSDEDVMRQSATTSAESRAGPHPLLAVRLASLSPGMAPTSGEKWSPGVTSGLNGLIPDRVK